MVVLIIFTVILQTVINFRMLFIGGQGECKKPTKVDHPDHATRLGRIDPTGSVNVDPQQHSVS